jgi:hypothetical protein
MPRVLLALALFLLSASVVLADGVCWRIPNGFAVTLPEGAEKAGDTFHLNPEGRQPRDISFMAASPGFDLTESGLTERVRLSGDYILAYRTSEEEAGGSGGGTARLGGALLEIGGPALLGVSCIAQDEYPNGLWCLPHLSTIRPLAADDACR